MCNPIINENNDSLLHPGVLSLVLYSKHVISTLYRETRIAGTTGRSGYDPDARRRIVVPICLLHPMGVRIHGAETSDSGCDDGARALAVARQGGEMQRTRREAPDGACMY